MNLRGPDNELDMMLSHIPPPTIKHHVNWIISNTLSHLNTNYSRFPNTAAQEDIASADPFAAIYAGLQLYPAAGDCKVEKVKILQAQYVVKAPLRSSEVVFCKASNCTVASSHPVPLKIELSKTPYEAQLPILKIIKTTMDIKSQVLFPKGIRTPFPGPDYGFQIFYPLYFEIRGEYKRCMRGNLRRILGFTLSLPSVTCNGTSNGFFEYQTICAPLQNQEIPQGVKTEDLLFNQIYSTFCKDKLD